MFKLYVCSIEIARNGEIIEALVTSFGNHFESSQCVTIYTCHYSADHTLYQVDTKYSCNSLRDVT